VDFFHGAEFLSRNAVPHIRMLQCRATGLLATRARLVTLSMPEVESTHQGLGVFKNVAGALAVLAAGLAASTPVFGDDAFPIVGTYTKDQICKGDGSDPVDLLVKITTKVIESNLGVCIILSRKRNGRAFSVQVECKAPGDMIILGDVTFTQRDDHALDFDDQDHTSPAVLYKCGK
jgi:hypothetical protein